MLNVDDSKQIVTKTDRGRASWPDMSAARMTPNVCRTIAHRENDEVMSKSVCVFLSAHAYGCALRSVHDYVHLFACQLCQITRVQTEHGHKCTRAYWAGSYLFIFTAMTHIQHTYTSLY